MVAAAQKKDLYEIKDYVVTHRRGSFEVKGRTLSEAKRHAAEHAKANQIRDLREIRLKEPTP